MKTDPGYCAIIIVATGRQVEIASRKLAEQRALINQRLPDQRSGNRRSSHLVHVPDVYLAVEDVARPFRAG